MDALSQQFTPGQTLAANDAQRRPFLVQIKSGHSVVMEFGAMGTDSLAVAAAHQNLCGPGQYVKATAAAWKDQVPFPIQAEQQALATAEIREAIPEAARIAADLAEDVAKGERRFALSYRRAIDDQVQHLRSGM